jgi:flagellar protein FliS
MANRVSVYLEEEILSANGLQLVHILYQATIQELREAKRNIASREVAAKCRNFSKACVLIGELLRSLDLEAGGEIAARLKALYEYMLNRLLLANVHNKVEPLTEVIELLSTLDEGWKELAKSTEPPQSVPDPAARFGMADMEVAAQGWSF